MAKVNDKEWVTVNVVGGGNRVVLKENVVGYCNCHLHRGCITRNSLKKHKCMEKGCVYFIKYKNASYWDEQNQQKQKKRDNKKQRDERSKGTDDVNKIREFVNEANMFCKQLGLQIVIVQIIKNHRDTEESYIINYVTHQKRADEERYLGISRHMKDKFHVEFLLRHTKLPDGTYANINEYKSITGMAV